MRLDRVSTDRHRRTENVIAILRRRAEFRRSRGEAVPPALRRAIDDFDRRADRRTQGRGPG